MKYRARYFTVQMLALSALMFGLPGFVYADSFGRLFTTPKQRVILDNLRHTPRSQSALKINTKKSAQKKLLKVNGVVVRSDGKNTVWINGTSNPGGNNSLVGVEVLNHDINSGSVSMMLSSRNKNISLKPGQTIDLMTGKINRSYKVK